MGRANRKWRNGRANGKTTNGNANGKVTNGQQQKGDKRKTDGNMGNEKKRRKGDKWKRRQMENQRKYRKPTERLQLENQPENRRGCIVYNMSIDKRETAT